MRAPPENQGDMEKRLVAASDLQLWDRDRTRLYATFIYTINERMILVLNVGRKNYFTQIILYQIQR